MRIRSVAVLAALLAGSVMAQETPLPSVDLPPALSRVLRDYERAWEARDPTALAALFTEDGLVLQNTHAPARGRAGIQQAYTGHGGPLSLRALDFATHGNVGYIIGAYGSKPASGDSGKFILALRRDRGRRWLIAADIDNSNRGPANAPPPDARDAVVDAANRLFAGMRERNEAALREVIHPRAQFIGLRGEPVARTAEEFIARIVARTESVDERIWQPEVRVDGDVATLWAPYDLHFWDRFSHCGIDSFQFVRVDGRWRLVSATYTQRTSGCSAPPQ